MILTMQRSFEQVQVIGKKKLIILSGLYISYEETLDFLFHIRLLIVCHEVRLCKFKFIVKEMLNSCLGHTLKKKMITQRLLVTCNYVLIVGFGHIFKFKVTKRKWCIDFFQIDEYRYLSYIYLAWSIICELSTERLVLDFIKHFQKSIINCNKMHFMIIITAMLINHISSSTASSSYISSIFFMYIFRNRLQSP